MAMMNESHMEALEEAIEMHQMHLDNPTTATPASQRELMRLLIRARMPQMSRGKPPAQMGQRKKRSGFAKLRPV